MSQYVPYLDTVDLGATHSHVLLAVKEKGSEGREAMKLRFRKERSGKLILKSCWRIDKWVDGRKAPGAL